MYKWFSAWLLHSLIALSVKEIRLTQSESITFLGNSFVKCLQELILVDRNHLSLLSEMLKTDIIGTKTHSNFSFLYFLFRFNMNQGSRWKFSHAQSSRFAVQKVRSICSTKSTFDLQYKKYVWFAVQKVRSMCIS